jgi:hypothetical protein
MDQLTPDYSSKRCPDCDEIKPLTEFTLSKKNRDGRGTYCRPCFNKRYRAHRARKAASEGRTVKSRFAVPSGFKYCPRCDEVQPVANFGSNRAAHDGLTAYCKPCHNMVGKETRERLYGGSREYHLRRRYGITGADFDAMVEAQGGTCAVCDQKPEHVDHDHRTGKVRGVLCFNCNQALGNVRDDAAVLQELISYLRRHRLQLIGPVEEYPTPEHVIFEVVYRHRAA